MFEYSIYAVLALIVIMFLTQAVRILREYERGVIFTLGRFTGVRGPGLIILIPVVQQLVKVDLRVMVQVVPPQDVISRDNVSVKVNAVLYFRIVDPERAIIKVGDYMAATSQLAQTTLRSVLGKHELDEMLAERDRLNADIQEILDKQTDVWGIKVTGIEIKDVDLNETMVRAIAKAGGGGTVAAREGDQRDGRTAGRRKAGRGRPDSRAGAAGDAAALLRGSARHRGRAVVDRRVSTANRPARSFDAAAREPVAGRSYALKRKGALAGRLLLVA
ncbi:regulator of protease activity HflC (stomatin/prohibitin superfamily) [Bradyrhizobium sp. LB1.3]